MTCGRVSFRSLTVAALLAGAVARAESPAAEIARAIRNAAFDRDACYRVRDLRLAKEDLTFYFTDGYLIFAQPVAGRRPAAMFTAEVEGGDGELILRPPDAGERMSLVRFANTPNLNEHFRGVLMIFTDSTAEELLAQVKAQELKPSAEMGALLASNSEPTLRNLLGSFEVRLVQDLAAPRPPNEGIFYAGLFGSRLGNFDAVHDPTAREQISVGQVVFRENRAFFDVWTSFESRTARQRTRDSGTAWSKFDFVIKNIRLDAVLDKELELSATTRLKIQAARDGWRVLPFEISRQMGVSRVAIDGVPVEVYQRESLRSNLIRGRESEVFLVFPSSPLEKGREYEVEFHHAGSVVLHAGENVYYVSSRGTWYPHHGMQFAPYDITFRYPAGLDVVATGDIVDDSTEGEWRVTRRRTTTPIRIAGFNLGKYERVIARRGDLEVEVFANRRLEPALQQQRPRDVILVPRNAPPTRGIGRQPELIAIPAPGPAPSPVTQADRLAAEIADSFQFMRSRFGPPSLNRITVSPVPGTFGQGFPGLIYLSTLSYLEPKDRPPYIRERYQQLFFSEILHAHEVAHQWWGNLIPSAGYQDDWMMEALANYAALLYLEKKNGPKALEAVLASYRERLLRKNPDGETVDSIGPIRLGLRLHSSQSTEAWRTITYEKGSWIMHMLRRRLGDEAFFGFLRELCRTHRGRPLTTGEFQAMAAARLPRGAADPKLENFFESWVYGTGIPGLKLTYTVKGKPPSVTVSGTLIQSDVPETFSVYVPVEIHLRGGKTMTRWLRSDNEGGTFSLRLPAAPLRVLLDPSGSVLAVRK